MHAVPPPPPSSARALVVDSRRALLALGIVALVVIAAGHTHAQGWEDDSADDDWSSTTTGELEPRSTAASGSSYGASDPTLTPWSLRAGLGFIHDPDDFLLNFELPYRFDRFISAGPMVQVGLEDNRLLVAPTANLTVTVPDMPGQSLDRFHPHVFVGIGFAVIENDDRGGDNRSAGFLVNTGFGLDYQLSPRVALGSRMIFNFLPERTLEERFFYSWEVLGVKFNF